MFANLAFAIYLEVRYQAAEIARDAKGFPRIGSRERYAKKYAPELHGRWTYEGDDR